MPPAAQDALMHVGSWTLARAGLTACAHRRRRLVEMARAPRLIAGKKKEDEIKTLRKKKESNGAKVHSIGLKRHNTPCDC